MRWTSEAEALLKRVPFFVRGRVKRAVEEWAKERGYSEITAELLLRAKSELKERASSPDEGYSVERCMGCKNALCDLTALCDRVEDFLREQDLTGFLRERVGGRLKYHNQFRVAMSACPNACSRVQIADFGVIATAKLFFDRDSCDGCAKCEEVCVDGAIVLKDSVPELIEDRCLRCGACAGACPGGAIRVEQVGYRVLVGGKLGRHPRLAAEVEGFASEERVLELLRRVVEFYKRHCEGGERLGTIIQKLGLSGAEHRVFQSNQ